MPPPWQGSCSRFAVSVRVLVCLAVTVALSGCGSRKAQAPPTPVLAATTISVPAGTELVVRVVEAIDVSQAVEGKSWAAVLSRDVRTPEGELLIGAGSPLYLGVTSTAGGLHLTLRSVVASGNSYLSGVPLSASGNAVTGLEPWGTAGTSADIRLNGPKVFVPGQALVALRLGEALTLR